MKSYASSIRALTLIATFGHLALTGQFAPAAEPAKTDKPAKPPQKMKPTNVTPAEAEALLQKKPETIVIDVRTQEEFAEGHIAGAKNVNFNAPGFTDRMKEFEGKSVLIHCAAGGRSSRALEALANQSFSELFHLNQGFNAWQAAGKPIQK
jgi:rhodanese-related sulfurtransferase